MEYDRLLKAVGDDGDPEQCGEKAPSLCGEENIPVQEQLRREDCHCPLPVIEAGVVNLTGSVVVVVVVLQVGTTEMLRVPLLPLQMLRPKLTL